MSFIYCHLNFHANLLRPWRFPSLSFINKRNNNILKDWTSQTLTNNVIVNNCFKGVSTPFSKHGSHRAWEDKTTFSRGNRHGYHHACTKTWKTMFIIKYLHKYTCNTIAHHKQEGRTEIVMKTTTCNKTWLTCKHL